MTFHSHHKTRFATADSFKVTMSEERFTHDSKRVDRLPMLECADAVCSSNVRPTQHRATVQMFCELFRQCARHLFRARSAGSQLRSGVSRPPWRHPCSPPPALRPSRWRLSALLDGGFRGSNVRRSWLLGNRCPHQCSPPCAHLDGSLRGSSLCSRVSC